MNGEDTFRFRPCCDTRGMAGFSRALRRRDLIQIGAVTLGVAWLGLLGAFAYAASTQQPSAAGLAAAASALLIGGAGILYAWREPGR
jgi:hypothetical protein